MKWLLLLAVMLLLIDSILHWTGGAFFTGDWDYYQSMVWIPKIMLLIALLALTLSIVSLIKGKGVAMRATSLLAVVFALGITLLSLIRLPEYHKVGEWSSPNGNASAAWYWDDPHDYRISVVTLKRPWHFEQTVFLYDRFVPGYVVWRDENILEIYSRNGHLAHTVDIRNPAPYVYLSYEDEVLIEQGKESTKQAIKEAEKLMEAKDKNLESLESQ